MLSKSQKKQVGILLATLNKLNNNNRCVYPECENPPIGSHVIQEALLERIAENQKVRAWKSYDDDVIKSDPNDQEWERVYNEPQLKGIVREVTYPIFCGYHDHKVFEPLETLGFDSREEQVALLAYRALCYKTWNPNKERIIEMLSSLKGPEEADRQQQLFKIEALLETRQQLASMLRTGDYTQLDCNIITLNFPPHVACADVFFPVDEDEDLREAIFTLAAEDVMTFSLFPHKMLDKSIGVTSWFKNSRRALKYIDALALDQRSDDDLAEMLISAAFRCSNIYISPTWWKSLSPRAKQEAKKLHLANAHALTGV